MVYGDPDADEGVTLPIHYSINSAMGWKHTISFSMPNNSMHWNNIAKVGNPTCSQQMTCLIRHKKRFQTQHHGCDPQVCRPLISAEFECLIKVYWKHPKRELGLCAVVSSAFQMYMIGQMDNTIHFN